MKVRNTYWERLQARNGQWHAKPSEREKTAMRAADPAQAGREADAAMREAHEIAAKVRAEREAQKSESPRRVMPTGRGTKSTNANEGSDPA